MNSYKKLISNSFIFAVGNIGSKLISFLLVPLYTYYLSTGEYGTVDLTITTVNMLLPIVSLSVYEALLRYVLEEDNDSQAILTNSIFISVVGFLVAIFLYPLLNYFAIFGDSLIYLYVILFVQMFERIFAQYARGTGKIKIFALNGILLTFSTGILNILFLVYFGLGVAGYYWAIILAYIISILFLSFSTKAYRDISFSHFDEVVSKKILDFSIPMIPNSLMWWLINASSRYFIRIFVGISANGLFAVASRIPSLLTIFNQIFTQAWQLSAIEEYESENKSEFYTTVFNHLTSVMFLVTSAIIIVVKYIFDILFAAEYFEAWKVVPFLLLGAVFSSFSGFLGTNYVAAKQTKGVFKTSVYGGIISLLLNALFIPTLGVVGAGISSMISFFVMFLIRLFDTRKYIEMEIKWFPFTASLIIIFLQIGILLMGLTSVREIMVGILLFVLLLIINKELFISGFKLIKAFLENKKTLMMEETMNFIEKYSVLMSIYSKEKTEYLRPSIDSMVNQSISPDEIVIVKDGPLTPELDEILDEYTHQYPELFTIVPLEKNMGLGLALNKGLKACKNELVARMDTDDISLTTRCEKQLTEFSKKSEIVDCRN